MKIKTWVIAGLLIVLIILALVSCQSGSGDKSKEIQFSSPCSDIVDPWTPMSQDERIEACQGIIGEKAAELAEMGWEPQDCQATRAEVQECGIGVELACTYTCTDTN
jgi:hypothetical protein